MTCPHPAHDLHAPDGLTGMRKDGAVAIECLRCERRLLLTRLGDVVEYSEHNLADVRHGGSRALHGCDSDEVIPIPPHAGMSL